MAQLLPLCVLLDNTPVQSNTFTLTVLNGQLHHEATYQLVKSKDAIHYLHSVDPRQVTIKVCLSALFPINQSHASVTTT